MSEQALHKSLPSLFGELVDGPPGDAAFVLNGGDAGLLASLDAVDAEAASTSVSGGATIAAHVDHVRYGLELLNRWHAGEANPWANANWSAAWRRTAVSEAEWAELRDALRHQARKWHAALKVRREMGPIELNGVIGSIAHLAYHLGAIRQINPALRGPRER
jgi:hypothetical protein